MVIASTFRDVFFAMAFVMLIWVPLMIVWFGTIADIASRPDISGWAKAAWMTTVVFLPFLGTLVYLIAHPQVFKPKGLSHGTGSGEFSGSADDLATVALLHERGTLSDAEFAAVKGAHDAGV